MEMFCYQCEQTKNGTGCTNMGVCGKTAEIAALQDLLLYLCKGIAVFGNQARKMGASREELDHFLLQALFSTITNVNFDTQRLKQLIEQAHHLYRESRELYQATCRKAGKQPEAMEPIAIKKSSKDLQALLSDGLAVGIQERKQRQGEDITGLQELILYGLKGLAAYAEHAFILGQKDEEVFAFVHETLAFLLEEHAIHEWTRMALRVGEVNLRVMELLDAANTENYGHPEPTQVRVEPRLGKAILVSGHDLKDLEEILIQTEVKGIDVYTHGEMLPCHGYPGLKKYKHLVGNYGTAWQNQKKEFDDFPGAIVMTTNCIQKPKESYQGRIFTTGLVAWPGVRHIENKDFSPAIQVALESPGFEQDGSDRTITVGFGRTAVLRVADKVVDAVKRGAIKHFFLVGGCDGAKTGRNYYTEFVEKTPKDTVVLTLACGKYRFNHLELGHIEGIPRLLDIGQCNDAYSAIRIASALAEAFGTDVNGLPLSFVLSWYEQKAVCILLSLLHLGIQGIRLGPSLPAFVSPAVLNVLVDKFTIAPTTNVEDDLRVLLQAR